jgi:predicted metal-binding protein
MDNPLQQLSPYIALALERGADHAKVIDTAGIITAPWVRLKCQFGCYGFGRSLCCPPHSPTPEQTRRVLDSYTHALLLHRHWHKGYTVLEEFNEMVVDLERTIFLDGYYKAWAMGSGPCRRCKRCNITGTCMHADKARPAMEACGIDVFATARSNEFPLQVLRTHKEKRNIFGVVLVE